MHTVVSIILTSIVAETRYVIGNHRRKNTEDVIAVMLILTQYLQLFLALLLYNNYLLYVSYSLQYSSTVK
ncbi:hypothetical protein M316_0041 [Nitrincola phage 1M3-16]|uniref:hypothetical protein n=1 Tax=Nitrincola phage 1M3-16 TaxID=1472912 RepID=UPI000444C022|nr:hypothetical protein GJ22_gp111 [Nitrincola phage 1M3-16]AHX01106.1 hypothetical protein M316_0041 [Nitrincola phage 1M3-16]